MPSAAIVDVDPGGVAGHRLVDRVVDDLPDEVVQAAGVGRADVHARALADRLEPLEDLDALGVVVGSALAGGLAARPTQGRGAPPGRRGARAALTPAALNLRLSRRSRGSSGQAVVEPPEILVAVVLDHDPAALPAPGRRRPWCPARCAGLPRPARGRDRRVGVAPSSAAGRRLAQAPGELLGLADRQTADRRSRRPGGAAGRRRQADQGPGVAFADATVGDGGLDARVELEQAQRVGDRGPGSADLAGDLILGQPELLAASWRKALASSIGLRSSRWTFSTSASSSCSRSASWRTIAGIRSRPASRAAWTRRSPATSR